MSPYRIVTAAFEVLVWAIIVTSLFTNVHWAVMVAVVFVAVMGATVEFSLFLEQRNAAREALHYEALRRNDDRNAPFDPKR